MFNATKFVPQAETAVPADLDFEKLKQPRKQRRSNRCLNRLFITDVQKVIEGRRAFGLWLFEMATVAFEIVLPRIVRPARKQGKAPDDIVEAVQRWAAEWLPEFYSDMGADWFEERALSPLKRNSFGTPDRESKRLRVRPLEKKAYGLRILVSEDHPKSVRKRARAEHKAARKRDRRAAAGANPHEKSAARLKPWEALGIGRTRYYDLKKAGQLDAFAAAREAGEDPRTVSDPTVHSREWASEGLAPLGRTVSDPTVIEGGHRSEIVSEPSISPAQEGDETGTADTNPSMVPAPTQETGHDLKTALHLVGLGSDDQDAIWVRLKANAAAAVAEFADLDDGFLAIRLAEWQPVAIAA